MRAPDAMGRVLVLGYGNPAREDDVLGPLVAQSIADLGIAGVDVDSDYQPNAEDAAAVAEHDTVVFVDASTDGPQPYSWAGVEPVAWDGFSTHALTVPRVLGMARELLGSRATAYLLGVRGYSFRAFCEEATPEGRRNAQCAARFLGGLLGGRPGGDVAASMGARAERGRP